METNSWIFNSSWSFRCWIFSYIDPLRETFQTYRIFWLQFISWSVTYFNSIPFTTLDASNMDTNSWTVDSSWIFQYIIFSYIDPFRDTLLAFSFFRSLSIAWRTTYFEVTTFSKLDESNMETNSWIFNSSWSFRCWIFSYIDPLRETFQTYRIFWLQFISWSVTYFNSIPFTTLDASNMDTNI